jgi:nitroreductase
MFGERITVRYLQAAVKMRQVDLYSVMRVAGQVRAFRPDPVPDATIARVLEHARFAPNGGNRQGWRVIVVTDPGRRRALRELHLARHHAYVAAAAKRASARGDDFAEHLDEIPVHLLVLVDLRSLAILDGSLSRPSIVGGASIYPFVQNILLALRNEGLGGAITTLVVGAEPELKTMFEIPPDYAVAALVLCGWPRDRLPTRLARNPVASFATRDSFAGPAFDQAIAS